MPWLQAEDVPSLAFFRSTNPIKDMATPSKEIIIRAKPTERFFLILIQIFSMFSV